MLARSNSSINIWKIISLTFNSLNGGCWINPCLASLFKKMLICLKIIITRSAAARAVWSLWHRSAGGNVTVRKCIKNIADRTTFLHQTLPSNVWFPALPLHIWSHLLHFIAVQNTQLQHVDKSHMKLWEEIFQCILVFWSKLHVGESVMFSAIISVSVNPTSVFHVDLFLLKVSETVSQFSFCVV